MNQFPMDVLLLILISGIISVCLVNLANGSCRPKTQLVAFNLTDQVPKSPLGLQQCERECFSGKNCQLMVYNVNKLACFKVTNIGVDSITEGSDFVVELRSEIASNLDTSYLCGNHQCENGFSGVALSSGVLFCMAGLCGEPVSITNAVVNADSYSISSIAIYSCSNGYYSIGIRDSTCGSSLEWSEVTLVCCKDGFTYDQGTQMMYQVFLQKRNYTDALGHCAGLGSGLVKINTTERMIVLCDYRSDLGYFTDASDQATEGTWIHSDGSDVNMTLFGPNEPSGEIFENCAVLYRYKQHDASCNTARNFICEVK